MTIRYFFLCIGLVLITSSLKAQSPIAAKVEIMQSAGIPPKNPVLSPAQKIAAEALRREPIKPPSDLKKNEVFVSGVSSDPNAAPFGLRTKLRTETEQVHQKNIPTAKTSEPVKVQIGVISGSVK